MAKRKKILLIFGIPLIVVLFISIMALLVQKNFNEGFERYTNSSFCGVIEKIYYQKDSRGLPTVVINSNSFYLGVNYIEIRDFIQIGDSICKEEGSNMFILCRLGYEGDWKCKNYSVTKSSVFSR